MQNIETFLRDFPTAIPEMREYRDLTGLGQELIFYSVLRGFKKAMDLWVPSERFEAFREFCGRRGLACFWDVKFVKPEDRSAISESVGAEYLTTTKTFAELPESKSKGTIHCFVSKSEEYAKNLYRYGWYPAISDDRVVYKNYQDLIEFRHGLGYPECCVDFFFEKNDWSKYNFPFEIFKRSDSFDFRCNPFWKDVGFSYLYHMPCSFSCAATAQNVRSVRDSLFREDPEMAETVDRMLRLPVLSIREQKTYAFQGTVTSDDTIEYCAAYRLWNRHEGDISEFLKLGNRLTVRENRHITVFDGDLIVFEYDCLGASQIETPFIIDFT